MLMPCGCRHGAGFDWRHWTSHEAAWFGMRQHPGSTDCHRKRLSGKLPLAALTKVKSGCHDSAMYFHAAALLLFPDSCGDLTKQT